LPNFGQIYFHLFCKKDRSLEREEMIFGIRRWLSDEIPKWNVSNAAKQAKPFWSDHLEQQQVQTPVPNK
jgi:hypothetical protein